MPVATTTASARPRVTTVFMWSEFDRSARGQSTATAPGALLAGDDSPVSVDSSTSTFTAAIRTASAGTRSPASTSTTSPATRVGAGTSTTAPSRRTRAVATSIDFRAVRLRWAFISWAKPSRAFRPSTTAITTVSLRSPTSPASTAANSRMTTRGLRNWSARIDSGCRGGASASSFGPPAARRPATSSAVSPRAGSTRSRAATSFASSPQGAGGSSTSSKDGVASATGLGMGEISSALWPKVSPTLAGDEAGP